MRNFTLKMVALLALCTLLITSCSNVPTPPAELDFLEFLISYDEIVAQLGPPDEKLKTGMTMYMYYFEDGSELMLVFYPSEDYVLLLISALLTLPDGTRVDLVSEGRG